MYYYKEGGLLLAPSSAWQMDLYGYETHGKGDVLFRTSIGAIAYHDFEMLRAVYKTIKQGRRWPEWLDHVNDAQSMAEKRRADRLNRNCPEEYPHTKYRYVGEMTRDPYIMFWTACKLMGWETYIEQTPLPFNIQWRPHTEAYRKYLIREKNIHLKIYEKFQHMSLTLAEMTGGLPVYALHLSAWMHYMTQIPTIGARIIQANKAWNLLIYDLCAALEPSYPVGAYRAKKGYQWTDEEKMESDPWFDESWYLDVGDQYKLDRDILHFVHYAERPTYQ